jgi:hypothetical protein
MPHGFWKMVILRKWWGGPPGPRARALVPLSEQQHQYLADSGRPTGASAADQGVRPTIYAECAAPGENYVALGGVPSGPPGSPPVKD